MQEEDSDSNDLILQALADLPEDSRSLVQEVLQTKTAKTINKDDCDIKDIQENYQLSQFWYSEETATVLSNEAIDLIKITNSPGIRYIGCISTPSVAFALNKILNSNNNVDFVLFEYDNTFSSYLPENRFCFYDYNFPKQLPDIYFHLFDVVIVDPPFLNEACLSQFVETINLLLKQTSATFIILCTGAILEQSILKLLSCKRTMFLPKHQSHLQNEFATYTNYNPYTFKTNNNFPPLLQGWVE